MAWALTPESSLWKGNTVTTPDGIVATVDGPDGPLPDRVQFDHYGDGWTGSRDSTQFHGSP